MDALFNAVIGKVRERFPLEEIPLDRELAEPKSFLKILTAKHYNWRADRFSKLFGMRFSVKLPPLDQLNSIFYPEPIYDTPIFLFFALLTKRKLVAHLNIYCPFDDDAYKAKHVEPLVAILQQYPAFECADRHPEWMKKYRQPCSIYGMFTKERLEDLSGCAFGYLDHYLQLAAAAETQEDPARLEQIVRFQALFREDIRTQDKAQGMIAKMIGKEKARRIFYEITT
ncbi:MAG: hypothetical protein OER85_08580 [Gammaproteobacteria bacterium]|nr:hypothetical protein [Gammaproteobacteria bacterium]